MCSLDRNMKYLVKGLRSPSGPLQYFFIFQLGKKKKKFMPYNYQHRYFFSEYPCFLTELEGLHLKTMTTSPPQKKGLKIQLHVKAFTFFMFKNVHVRRNYP